DRQQRAARRRLVGGRRTRVLPVGQAVVQPRPDAHLIASAAMRSRELGIRFGDAEPGPLDAITDVAGVRVGSVTLIEGEDVRTGVTVIVPSEADVGAEQLFAGCHTLNGNGELTGLEWVRESGRLTTPIAITNTHSVGVVRDALVAHS